MYLTIINSYAFTSDFIPICYFMAKLDIYYLLLYDCWYLSIYNCNLKILTERICKNLLNMARPYYKPHYKYIPVQLNFVIFIFKCVHAFLYEGLYVGPSIDPSVRLSIRPSVQPSVVCPLRVFSKPRKLKVKVIELQSSVCLFICPFDSLSVPHSRPSSLAV